MSKSKSIDKYDALKLKFAKFLAIPDKKTQEEFAKENDLAPDTLSRWKRDPIVRDKYIEEVEKNLLYSYADVMEAIKSRAKRGEYNQATLYLKQMGKLREAKEEAMTQNNVMIQILNDLREDDTTGDKKARRFVEAEDPGKG